MIQVGGSTYRSWRHWRYMADAGYPAEAIAADLVTQASRYGLALRMESGDAPWCCLHPAHNAYGFPHIEVASSSLKNALAQLAAKLDDWLRRYNAYRRPLPKPKTYEEMLEEWRREVEARKQVVMWR